MAIRRDRRCALVPSHWLLDFFVRGPDLPLWPGGPESGLGGRSSVPLTIVLELLVFVPCIIICIIIYLRATKARDRIGSIALWAYLAALVLFYFGGFLGPPPTDVTQLAWGGLLMWLFVPWTAWFDRHREAV